MIIDSSVFDNVLNEVIVVTFGYGLVAGMGLTFISALLGFLVYKVFPSFFNVS